MSIIYLPYRFYPRGYQFDTMCAFFINGYRNSIDIEHRCAGKDNKSLNIMVTLAQQCVCVFVYTVSQRYPKRKE
ncbi:hypothetical protein [Candidatus Coxiella mudrowiae]|uniref:hypothetical protein n=1 Tax=Candidatus Coxiella mudrowiae TaxID=2054173 RepID=UPI0006627793|nr:hypothetical protein [Candidatus Coxiella mudrowiae]